MFVNAGARAALLKDERTRFLRNEWPRTRATIERLGFSVAELLEAPIGGADISSESEK
jgi:GntR family transcriptional regulator